jgi:benzoylformate decarboxylase
MPLAEGWIAQRIEVPIPLLVKGKTRGDGMRGKQLLMESLIAHDVSFIFGNPGTTESPLMDSLLEYPQLRYILTLHEGVALGAANHYAQASGKTGVVNVHVAPGLGNSLGMLYNAMKANSPLLVTAGQQDTRMRLRDPLLGHNLAAMAAPLVKWSVQAERADELSLLLHRAFKVANDPPAGPVFVSLPIDVLEQETDRKVIPPGVMYRCGTPDPSGVERAAALLLERKRPAIVIGDDVARSRAGDEVLALAEAIGAPVWCEGIHMHMAVPSTHPNFRLGLPFDVESIRKVLEGSDAVLLVGGLFFEEVWFAPGSPFPEQAALIHVEESISRLAHNHGVHVGLVGHPKAVLHALRGAVEAGAGDPFREAAARRNRALRALKDEESASQRSRAQKRWDREPISMARVMAEIAAALPESAVVVDESITASLDLARTIGVQAPGDYYGTRGGGIGQALPGALGVKLAHPDRPVVAISGDGSAMYSIQALWTAAHHDLAIVFVILNNGEYRILKHNLDTYRLRFGVKPDRPYPHMDLRQPGLGFVDLARGLGVQGARVSSPGDLGPALHRAFSSKRPYLLDVLVEGKD